MRPNLITRLKEEWNTLDPVDPLRGLIADTIDALAQAPTEQEQPAQQQEPVAWGWTIMHSDGTYAWIRPRIADFFGSIQERDPYTSEDAKHADREWAGLAPHTIVTLYTSPQPAQQEHFDHKAAANAALRDAQNRSYQVAKSTQPAQQKQG